jgi:hypothetical protein
MADYHAEMYWDRYEDDWDDEPWDDYYSNTYRRTPSLKTCKFCGTEKLHWLMVDDRWKLHDSNGDIHRCGSNVIKNIRRIKRHEINREHQ